MLTYCLDLSAVRAKKRQPRSNEHPAAQTVVSDATRTGFPAMATSGGARGGQGGSGGVRQVQGSQEHLAVLKVRNSSEDAGTPCGHRSRLQGTLAGSSHGPTVSKITA